MLPGTEAPSSWQWSGVLLLQQRRDLDGLRQVNVMTPNLPGMQVLTVARSLAKGAPFRCIALTGAGSSSETACSVCRLFLSIHDDGQTWWLPNQGRY